MARDPNNIMNLQPGIDEHRTINIIPEYHRENYDLNDQKQFIKYIKAIELDIRKSIEYQQFISYIKEYAGMNRCTYLPMVSCEDTYKIRIELHHEPLTLYDIVMAIYKKRVAFRESLDEFMVAKEVMYVHYKLNVGLIPVCETIHELIHSQYLFVPTYVVFGKYKEFVKAYEAYIEPETLNTLSKIEKISETFDIEKVRNFLQPHMLTIDAAGAGIPNNKDEIMTFIKSNLDRLDQLQS